MDKKKFGFRLKTARKFAGMTANQVAEYVGLSTGEYYTRYERGTVSPPLDMAVKLSNLFEVSLDYLILDSLENEVGTKDKFSRLSPRDQKVIDTMMDEMIRLDLQYVGLECETWLHPDYAGEAGKTSK